MAAVQNLAGRVFQIPPEALYGLKIPVSPDIVTVPSRHGFYMSASSPLPASA